MAGTAVPPALQGPTSKEKKYDRQLRLWAASGQAALEESHILLINSGPGVVGIETLKNLVLPGIGRFTIQDSALVSDEDLGVNFFLEQKHVGAFRAEHTCELLKELNPDVQGSYITEPVEIFLSKPESLSPYTLILVTAPINPELLATISAHASATQVPLFYIHSVGFFSSFSVQLPSAFPIVDTHPDPETISDLRLLTPWPALLELTRLKTQDLDAMNDHDHGHVPWAILLLYYLEEWKASHEGKVPQNYKEKTAFRDLVARAARTNNPEGGEENFDEAVAAVLKSLNPAVPSSSVREVFEAPECQNLTATCPSFWVIANAISSFYKTLGELPLPGSVPDMKAVSSDYIHLQNVYKTKAREDFGEVLSIVRSLEKSLRRPQPIDEKDVEAFCKGAGHIKLIRGRPFHIARPGEKIAWGDRASSSATSLQMPDSLITLYIAFLAYDMFCASHLVDGLGGALRAPGMSDVDKDSEKLEGMVKTMIDDLLNEAGQFIEEPEYLEVKVKAFQYVQEISRAAGSELHNISSLTGGMVAQEVIKAITKQYVPVDNTCLFDGVASKSSVLRL